MASKRKAREIEDTVDYAREKGLELDLLQYDTAELTSAIKYLQTEEAKTYVARSLRRAALSKVEAFSPGGIDADVTEDDELRWARSEILQWSRLADQLEGRKTPTKVEMPAKLKRRYETTAPQRASRRHGNRAKYTTSGDLVPKLHVELDVMKQLTLKMNVNAITRAVGTRLALMVRKSLRQGKEYHGPPGDPGRDGKPFIESGRMLKDLRYDKYTQTVGPTHRRKRGDLADRVKVLPKFDKHFRQVGTRTIRGNRRVQTSYAVMAVNIAKGIFRDPMGSTRPQTQVDINKWTKEQLDELVAQGKGVTLEAAIRQTLLMGTRRGTRKK